MEEQSTKELQEIFKCTFSPPHPSSPRLTWLPPLTWLPLGCEMICWVQDEENLNQGQGQILVFILPRKPESTQPRTEYIITIYSPTTLFIWDSQSDRRFEHSSFIQYNITEQCSTQQYIGIHGTVYQYNRNSWNSFVAQQEFMEQFSSIVEIHIAQ